MMNRRGFGYRGVILTIGLSAAIVLVVFFGEQFRRDGVRSHLRDQYAGQAMQTILQVTGLRGEEMTFEQLSVKAWLVSEAMLDYRNMPQEELIKRAFPGQPEPNLIKPESQKENGA